MSLVPLRAIEPSSSQLPDRVLLNVMRGVHFQDAADVGYDRNAILAALKRNFEIGKFPSDDVYGSGSSGKKMADLLARLPSPSRKG
jgi:hypothetical protein